LDAVKASGRSKWVARCPAHQDRSPSLAIRELDDGRLLVHCFAGCEVTAVLGAVGLDLTDLYPDRLCNDSIKQEARPFPATQILDAIAFEALVVAVAASNIANGITLSDADRDRLLIASSRLQRAVEVARA
jgi:hypothetical protein